MALTVGQDTYISVADADAYWTARNDTEWGAASQAAKEAALLQATQYIDKEFRWIGVHPGSSSQLLSWPRLSAYDSQGRIRTGIPLEVAHATAELAREALSGPVLPTRDEGSPYQSVKVGPISVNYAETDIRRPSYDFVRHMLRPLIQTGGRRLERV